MILNFKNNTETLSIRYYNEPLIRAEIDRFKVALCQLFDRITEGESEEHYKNLLADFLKNAFYSPDYEINTKDRQDLVIHTGKTSAAPVGLIVEVKRPENIGEMFSPEKPNSKALHELIHYYFQERLSDNKEIKHLIITNLYDWYFFDANDFEKYFYGNKKLRENYIHWKQGELAGKTTDWLYQEILKPFCEKELETINLTHCKLRDYETQARQEASEKDIELDYVFKLFSPIHLLKLPFGYDANQLNEPFYFELLHVLGLMEKMENGILKIKRIEKIKDRNDASFLENTIQQILVSKKLENTKKYAEFGEDLESQLFSIALELCITWLNRILFLKLLEGQLLRYHSKNPQYAFLHIDRIQDFDELDELFFEIFNKPISERKTSVVQKYGNLPYLNSALFEITDLEKEFFRINSLKNRLVLPFFEQTAIKDHKGVSFSKLKNAPPHKTLPYLFAFLNAYDFGSETGKGIRQDSKTIMNAAVLGLIFEKINGYEDGSFFTPQFITEYMCRETVRKAVLRKFQEVVRADTHNGIESPNPQGFENLAGFEQLKESLNTNDPAQRKWANEVINSVRICDPAVGSGHFLVAVLNEFILLKHELDILCYRDGFRIKEYTLVLDKDEFEFLDAETNVKFVYKPISAEYAKGKMKIPDRQRFQEAIFHEKQALIENCLFGVDINAKSVSICRLRLWIELLKNAYYTQESQYRELQTLPNIDINIKTGNSLVSRFGLNGKTLNPQGFKNLAGLKPVIERYKILVRTYKETRDSRTKDDLRRQIGEMKQEFEKFATPTDKDLLELRKKEAELTQIGLSFDGKLSDLRKAEQEVQELHAKYKEKVRTLYYNAFEWRFEFPEILDEEGNFVGFDAIVGNPPYIKEYEGKDKFKALRELPLYQGKMDMWYFFVDLGSRITKKEGDFGFIAPNNWVTNAGASKLREKVLNDIKIVALLDFGSFMVFTKASIQTMIMLFENQSADSYAFDYRKIEGQKLKFEDVKMMFLKQKNNQTIFLNPIVRKEDLKDKFLIFVKDEYQSLLEKIEQKQNFYLYEKNVSTKNIISEVAQGIVTPQDFINKKSLEVLNQEKAEIANGIHPHHASVTKTMLDKLQNKYDLNTGIFVLSNSEIAKMQIPDFEKTLLKPLYTSQELKKYACIKENQYWIIYTRSHFKNQTCILHYPTIKAHLDQFKAVITSDNKPYGLHRSREENFFRGEKILSLRKCTEPTFTYVDSDCYVQAEYYVIKTDRIGLKYLTALLNSKLMKFYLKNAGKMQGNIYQVDKEPLMKMPICVPENQKPFIKLVDQILKAKKEGKETAELEAQIDALVFDLYGMTEEERQAIKAK